MSNSPYRIKGEVEEETVPKGLTASNLRKVMESKFRGVNVDAYWVDNVQPMLLSEAKKGGSATYIFNLSRNFATYLAAHGEKLGFETRSDYESVRVSWEKKE